MRNPWLSCLLSHGFPISGAVLAAAPRAKPCAAAITPPAQQLWCCPCRASGAVRGLCRAPLALCCSLLAARLEHGAIPVPKAAGKLCRVSHLTLPRAEAQAHSDGHLEQPGCPGCCRPLGKIHQLQSPPARTARLLQQLSPAEHSAQESCQGSGHSPSPHPRQQKGQNCSG